MGLRNADRRSRKRKIKDYLKSYGGIILGAVVFFIGLILYIFVEFLKGGAA